MSLRSFVITLILASILAWGSYALVVTTIDPTDGGWFAIPAFYLTLGVALLGTFSLIGIAIRSLMSGDEPIYRRVLASLRQSTWYTVLIVILLVLQHLKLLRWWNVGILIVALLVLEYTVLVRQSHDT